MIDYFTQPKLPGMGNVRTAPLPVPAPVAVAPYMHPGQGTLFPPPKPHMSPAQYSAAVAAHNASMAPAASRFSRILAASPAALNSVMQSARSLPGAAGKILGIGGMAYGLADTMFNPGSADVLQLLAKERAEADAAHNMRNYQPRNPGMLPVAQPPAPIDHKARLEAELNAAYPLAASSIAARSVMPTQLTPVHPATARTYVQPAPVQTYTQPAPVQTYTQPVSAYSNPSLPVYDKAMEAMSMYAQQPPAMVTMPTPEPVVEDIREAPPGWFWNSQTLSWSKTPY